jgi:hypothetical protein
MRESAILAKMQALVRENRILISAHGYDEMAADGISSEDALAGLLTAEAIEEYPDAAKGPTVLVLEYDSSGAVLHVVWGIPKGFDGPAVLVTAYRPDPERWSDDLRRRKK